MAIANTTLAQILFKASQGKSSTATTRDFFEEPIDGRPIVYPRNIWAEAVKIPTTAPGGADAAITGVVQRFISKSLTAVLGTTNAFYHADLIDCIPFNTGDGSYNYALTDSAGTAIPFGQGDWLVDPNTGTVTFYGTVPANMPPKISFYKYVGLKGALPPRYTTAERDALASPIAGQQIFNTTTNSINVYSGTSWGEVGTGGGGGGRTNYALNPDFETDITGVTFSANTTANAVPDGGYVASTVYVPTRATAGAIAGTASLLITKGAGNTLGTHLVWACKPVPVSDQDQQFEVVFTIYVNSASYQQNIDVWVDLNGTLVKTDNAQVVAASNGVQIITHRTSFYFAKQTAAITPKILLHFTSNTSPNTIYFDSVYFQPALPQPDIQNYFYNGRFDRDLGGWATYFDTAASAPVNGAGYQVNPPDVTIAREVTSPTRNVGSLKFVKPNTNTQGQGVSAFFTIDEADTGKPMQISFDQKLVSGTTLGGDIGYFVYDMIGNVMTSLGLATTLTGTTSPAVFKFTAGLGTKYRLIIHSRLSTSNAMTVLYDNFRVASISALTALSTSTGLGGDTLVNYIANGKAETDTSGVVMTSDIQALTPGTPANATNDFLFYGPTLTEIGNGIPVTFAGGTLPSPLVAGTVYWVRDSVNDGSSVQWRFKVAATNGGAAIDLTTNGSGNVTMYPGKPIGQGASGTVSSTLARSTTNPLRGTASFVFTKPAAITRGEGWSIPFVLDNADLVRTMQCTFEFNISSGTYNSGDLSCYIINDSTGYPLADVDFQIQSVGQITMMGFKFNPVYNVTNYRLVFHTTGVGTNTFAAQFDSISVGPMPVNQGTFTSNLQFYTPAVSGLGSGSLGQNKSSWYQHGEHLFVTGYMFKDATAGSGTTQIKVGLPSGLSIDYNKLAQGSNLNDVGNAVNAGSGVVYAIYANTDSTISFYSTSGFFKGSDYGANANFSFEFKVPIAGWSSNMVLSSDLGGFLGPVIYSGNSGTSQAVTAGSTNITYTTLKDSTNSWNGSQYKVVVPGDYEVSTLSYGQGVAFTLMAAVNGVGARSVATVLATGGGAATGSATLVDLKKDDLISLQSQDNNSTIGGRNLYIKRIVGVSNTVIAQVPPVVGRWVNTSGQALPNSTVTTTTGWTKASPTSEKGGITMNASTGVINIPYPGIYLVEARLITNTAAWSANGWVDLVYSKDGAGIAGFGRIDEVSAGNTRYGSLPGTLTLEYLAPGTLTIGIGQFSGSAKTLYAAVDNRLNVIRLSD